MIGIYTTRAKKFVVEENWNGEFSTWIAALMKPTTEIKRCAAVVVCTIKLLVVSLQYIIGRRGSSLYDRVVTLRINALQLVWYFEINESISTKQSM